MADSTDFPTLVLELSQSGPLEAPDWLDITTSGVGRKRLIGWSSNRGRSGELDDIPPGRGSITLDNYDGDFDPDNTASPFFAFLTTNRRLRITATWNSIDYIVFDQYVDWWPMDDDPTFPSRATTVTTTGALGMLANREIKPARPFTLDHPELGLLDSGNLLTGKPHFYPTLSGLRIKEILKLIGWPADLTDVDDGITPIVDDYPTDKVLPYFQTIARSEMGALYDSADGMITYRQRRGWSRTTEGRTSQATFSDTDGIVATTDSFTRANSATDLHSTNGGTIQAWVPQAGSVWGITVNRAYCAVNGSPNSDSFATVDIAADIDCTVTIQTLPGGAAQAGLVFRYQDGDNWMSLWVDGTDSNLIKVIKVEATVFTLLDTYGTASAGDVLRVVANGSDIDCYVNASLVGSISSAFNTTATKVGMYTNGTAGRFDNFAATGILTGIPYDDVTIDSGSRALIKNRVTRTARNGPTFTSIDTDSIALYGAIEDSKTDLLTARWEELVGMCQYIISRYATGVPRVTALVVTAIEDPDTMYPLILGSDLGWRFTVGRTPKLGGAPIFRECLVESVAHEVHAPAMWRTTWTLSEADTHHYFTLDDPVYGLLDSGNVFAF